MAAQTLRPRGRVGVVHVHSAHSHDSRDTLDELRLFALERGISFVGLTDHAEDMSAEAYGEYVASCRALSDDAVTLIPGLEFRFAGFTGLHLLALGLRRWIAPATPEAFLSQTEGVCGLTILAHPILANYTIPAAVTGRIDAIEVWNASYNTRYLPDPRAIQLLHRVRQARPEVVAIAGLDQHDCSNDRATRIVLQSVDGGEEPIAETRAGRFKNIGKTLRFDSAARLSRVQLGALSVARTVFDGIERTQERLARA